MSDQPTLDDVLPFLEHILISNIRLYDVMLTLLDEIAGNEAGNKLRAMHMRGEYFYPPVDVYEDPDADGEAS